MSVMSWLLRRSDGDQTMLVEPLRRRDLAEIEPIEQVSYPRPWSLNIFQSEIELARAGDRYYVVARRGGDLVGYAGMMFAVGDAHVTNIATSPAHRRSGVATRLLAELASQAIIRGCVAMTLEVRATNTAAQALYRTFGFIPAGVRQKYYENVDDAIVMWCHEIGAPAYRQRLRELCPEAARDL
jgi:ribosomal-protein-alanine N-acetyltransferase